VPGWSATASHQGSDDLFGSSNVSVEEPPLVVDDIASADPWRVRFLEIRGTADAIPGAEGSAGSSDEAVIRIHPTRILSFGIEEPPLEPHLTRLRTGPSLNR
jgi:hypothetical protein